MGSSQTGCDFPQPHFMDTSKRRTLSKLCKSIAVLTKDLLTEQINCEGRNHIPVEFKPPRNWVEESQYYSLKPGLFSIPPHHPENLLLSGDRFCCFAASWKRSKTCGSIEKNTSGRWGRMLQISVILVGFLFCQVLREILVIFSISEFVQCLFSC